MPQKQRLAALVSVRQAGKLGLSGDDRHRQRSLRLHHRRNRLQRILMNLRMSEIHRHQI